MTEKNQTPITERMVLNLSQRDLQRRFRGNFSVIAILLQHHDTHPNEAPLYHALKHFVASSHSKSFHDWDRLLSAIFLPAEKTLLDFFTQETAWKTVEEYSPLLEYITPFLVITPQEQGALHLKRAYLEVIQNETAFIHAENTWAFYSDVSGNVPYTVPFTHNPLQLNEIRTQLAGMNPRNTQEVNFLKILMGPCIHEACAQARQFFYHPVNLFLRQCFWLVFHAAQEEGKKGGDALALHHALTQLLTVYTETYPTLSTIFTEKSACLFADNALNGPLLNTLITLKSTLDTDNPLLVDLLFMPTAFHQPQEYRLKTVEKAYIDAEKVRFKAEITDFLSTATETQKSRLRRIFSVTNGDNDALAEIMTQTHTNFLDEEYQWSLIPTVQQKNIAPIFFAHGVKFLHHNHHSDWALLKEALKNYSPNQATDALFLTVLLNYCDEEHHIDRFETIRYALKSAHSQQSLVDTILDNATQKTVFYQRKPRLLKFAERFKAIQSDAIADVLLAMPAFLAPLPNYNFNEQANFCRLAEEDFEAVCDKLPETAYDIMDLRKVHLTPEKARTLFYGLMTDKKHSINGTKNLILNQPFEQYGHIKKRNQRTILTYCLRSLPYYEGLEAMYADNTQLTDKTLIPFMESLVKVKSVIILTLRHNFITDKGLIAFSHFIQNNRRAKKWFKHLTLLDLSGNLITDTGVMALKKALSYCSDLSMEWGNNLAISDTVKADVLDDAHEENHRMSASDRDSDRLSENLRPSLTRDSLLTRDSQSLQSGTTSHESIMSAFKEKRLRQRSASSSKSSNSTKSDKSPQSVNNHRLSFSTLSDEVIEKISSGLSTEKKSLLHSSINNKIFSIPKTILEEEENNLTEFSQFIEEEEINAEEIIIPKKIMTSKEFQQLLEALCVLKNLKKLDVSKVTVIPNEDETTIHQDTASLLIQVLVSVLPKFERLETVDFGKIKLFENNLKQLIESIPKMGRNLTKVLINSSDIDEEIVAEFYGALSEKSPYALLEKPSNAQKMNHNPYILQSLKPCAIIKKNSIPNESWQYYNNGIDFYYVIFTHPRIPKQLFFVNQEKEVKIKKINYHLKDFFDWLDTQLPELKNSPLLDEIILLTDEQLLTIRDIIQHNYLEEEKYRLVPMTHYTEQLAIRCHNLETMRCDRMAMEKNFFNATQYKHRHDYFYALYTGLCRTIEARSLLSTGLFSTAEQGTLGTYANYLAGAITAAFPPTAALSLSLLLVADAIDGIERESFNQNVATLSNKKTEEKEQGFFTLCLLILLKHIDQCEEHTLTLELAEEEIRNVVDFLTQQHSLDNPLFFSNDSMVILTKMPDLMDVLFNDSVCILPLKKSDEQQAMESLQRGVHLTTKGTDCLPMPDTFVVPFGYNQFSDAKLPKSLREKEKDLRLCLINLATSYQKIWTPKNFYHDFFIKNIQRHGGPEVMKLAKQLDNMAKTLTYYQLVEAIPAFLKELEKKSGKRKGSLQTLLVKALSPHEPVPVKNCSPFLFLNEGKKIDEQRQSIIDTEQRLSDCINNRT